MMSAVMFAMALVGCGSSSGGTTQQDCDRIATELRDNGAGLGACADGGSGNTVNLTTDSGPTTINGGNGNDIINVMNDAVATTVNGGNDIINVQAIGFATQVNRMGDTVNVGSNAQ